MTNGGDHFCDGIDDKILERDSLTPDSGCAKNMKDSDCVAFLQQVLPQLGMRWPGFRKVRRQVCKRLDRRLQALDLADLNAYRTVLKDNPAEWLVLESLCRISISRFLRDRGVWEVLEESVLPALARNVLDRDESALRAWCVGCASGEEPYTLNLVWQLAVQTQFPGVSCQILATDIDPHLLQRARRGCYPASSLRELPAVWRGLAFEEHENNFCLRPEYRLAVTWRAQNIRTDTPGGLFDLILCRNLVFTYFDEPNQVQILARFCEQLRPGGALVTGKTEHLPGETERLVIWDNQTRIYGRS
jgi:chemotaxis protein methyltransferase CheR